MVGQQGREAELVNNKSAAGGGHSRTACEDGNVKGQRDVCVSNFMNNNTFALSQATCITRMAQQYVPCEEEDHIIPYSACMTSAI